MAVKYHGEALALQCIFKKHFMFVPQMTIKANAHRLTLVISDMIQEQSSIDIDENLPSWPALKPTMTYKMWPASTRLESCPVVTKPKQQYSFKNVQENYNIWCVLFKLDPNVSMKLARFMLWGHQTMGVSKVSKTLKTISIFGLHLTPLSPWNLTMINQTWIMSRDHQNLEVWKTSKLWLQKRSRN